jgi:periplasmic copper chaperone A
MGTMGDDHPVPRSRLVAAALVAVALLVLLAAPAGAHVDIDPTEAPAGSTTVLTFSFLHGKEGTATTALSVQMPAGAEVVDTPAVDGWEVDVDDDGELPVVTWSGGSAPDGVGAAFPVEVRLPSEPGTVLFPTIQTTEAGDLDWISADEGAGEDVNAAPRIVLVENPDATTTTTEATTTTIEATTTTTEADDEATGPTTSLPATTVQADDPVEGGSLTPWVIGGGLAALVLVVGGGLLLRNRASA